jgi:DNA invertase Pin-like site-specific DNA recombinase
MSTERPSARPGADAGIHLGLGGWAGGESTSGRGILIGYARCSTERQDLTAQRRILSDLGVADDRVYLDHGLTGRNRSRPGLTQALAALRAGDTLVVPKLDRPARSVPDARAIGDSPAARGVRLSLGGAVYDPADPMGKCFFNILATFAEFEVDLLRMRTREGMAVARAKGKLKGKPPKLSPTQRALLAALYRSVATTELLVEHLTATDWARVAELTDKYADQHLGGVDAGLIALVERLGLTTIATLDHRHFGVVIPRTP